MTSFLILKQLFLREATLLKGIQLCAKGNSFATPDCEASDSDLLVSWILIYMHIEILLLLFDTKSIALIVVLGENNFWYGSSVLVIYVRHFKKRTLPCNSVLFQKHLLYVVPIFEMIHKWSEAPILQQRRLVLYRTFFSNYYIQLMVFQYIPAYSLWYLICLLSLIF